MKRSRAPGDRWVTFTLDALGAAVSLAERADVTEGEIWHQDSAPSLAVVRRNLRVAELGGFAIRIGDRWALTDTGWDRIGGYSPLSPKLASADIDARLRQRDLAERALCREMMN